MTNTLVDVMSEEVLQILWEDLILNAFESLVEGYAHAKKCSPQGRALMKLDFSSLCNALELESGMRPLPHVSYVENYLSAYYYPTREEMLEWMFVHQEYSLEQHKALFAQSLAPQLSRRERQEFLQKLEAFYR